MHSDLAVAVVSNCSSSERRIAANRANARKSTGPRTPEGKAIVAGNATKHGLRSERVVETKPSRRRAFEEFEQALRSELKPFGMMQSIVFGQVAALAWKLKSMPAVERRMLREDRVARRKVYAERYERIGDAAEPIAPGELSDVALVARWFHRNRGDAGNAYATLRRYEAGIERSFYRACAELKRLQKEAPDAGPVEEDSGDASGDALEAPRSDLAEQSQDSEASGDSAVGPTDGRAAVCRPSHEPARSLHDGPRVPILPGPKWTAPRLGGGRGFEGTDSNADDQPAHQEAPPAPGADQ